MITGIASLRYSRENGPAQFTYPQDFLNKVNMSVCHASTCYLKSLVRGWITLMEGSTMSEQQAYYFRANMMTMFFSTLVALLIAIPLAVYVATKVVSAQVAQAATFAPQTAQVNPSVAYAPSAGGCNDPSMASASGGSSSTSAGNSSVTPAGLVSGAISQIQRETNTTTTTTNNNYSYVNSFNQGSYNTDNSVNTSTNIVTTTVTDNSQTDSNNNIGNTNNSNNTTTDSNNTTTDSNNTTVQDSYNDQSNDTVIWGSFNDNDVDIDLLIPII